MTRDEIDALGRGSGVADAPKPSPWIRVGVFAGYLVAAGAWGAFATAWLMGDELTLPLGIVAVAAAIVMGDA